MPSRTSSARWAFAITAVALFMVSLDNLVVITALPVIRRDLAASLQDLEWLVNAYTLTFAVLLLTGAALGDRYGRRRMLAVGLAVFTAGSAAAALSPTTSILIAARATQGLGAAIVTPLTLTVLTAAVPVERRALALGAWGGVGGLAIAFGPLVGGAIVQGISWHWIFWLNVPIGIAAVTLAVLRLEESFGPEGRLDLVGLALVTAGLFGIVFGVIHGNDRGWTDWQVVGGIALGAVLLMAFLGWEARASAPMLPLRLFRGLAFSTANAVAFLLFFGMFGSIFLLSQFFQIVQGLNPFQAGLRILPWTAMPGLVAPLAGALSGRTGPRAVIAPGMALMAIGLAWIAAVSSPTVAYSALVPPFVVSGIGMGMFFAPIANVVMSGVPSRDQGKASGANNAIRELGGVFGVAVLASVFSANGSYATRASYVHGLVPAVAVGAVIVGAGTLVALRLPGPARVAVVHSDAEPDEQAAEAAA